MRNAKGVFEFAIFATERVHESEAVGHAAASSTPHPQPSALYTALNVDQALIDGELRRRQGGS
jgi:hypothetical protein